MALFHDETPVIQSPLRTRICRDVARSHIAGINIPN